MAVRSSESTCEHLHFKKINYKIIDIDSTYSEKAGAENYVLEQGCYVLTRGEVTGLECVASWSPGGWGVVRLPR